jgi:hypothetical protein
MLAGLTMATSSFFVVTNSLRLRRFAALGSDTPAPPAPALERELQAISSV